MKLPYILNPIYRLARRSVFESVKPTLRGRYNQFNKYATYQRDDIFTALDIEINSACNIKCAYCPVCKHDRGEHYMPEKLFCKIIDDLAAFPFEYQGRISPHFFNEPLLDQGIGKLMSYVKKKLPKAQVIIHTNGILLTNKKIIQLIDLGVDGFIVTDHVKSVLSRLNKDIRKLEKKYRQKVFFQSLKNMHLFNRAGSVEIDKPKFMNKCFYLSDEIAIDYQGRVVCTNDFFVEHPFGDLNKKSLQEIWWDKKFIQIRNNLKKGKIDLAICKKCLRKN